MSGIKLMEYNFGSAGRGLWPTTSPGPHSGLSGVLRPVGRRWGLHGDPDEVDQQESLPMPPPPPRFPGPVRLARLRTPPSQGGNGGSNPPRGAQSAPL